MIYKDFRSSVSLHIDALMPCHNINLYLLLMAPKMVQLPHFSLVHGLVVFMRGGEISLKKTTNAYCCAAHSCKNHVKWMQPRSSFH